MNSLIGECLGPVLAVMVRERGFPGTMHVAWIVLWFRQDRTAVRRLVEGGYALVTHESTNFTTLKGHKALHPGPVA